MNAVSDLGRLAHRDLEPHPELGQRPLQMADMGASLEVQHGADDLFRYPEPPCQLAAVDPRSRIAVYRASFAATSSGTKIIGRPFARPGRGIGSSSRTQP